MMRSTMTTSRSSLGRPAQPLASARGRANVEAFGGQRFGDGIQRLRVVIDDQNVGRNPPFWSASS